MNSHKQQDIANHLLRIMLGIIFIGHGILKINMGIDALTVFLSSVGIPLSSVFAYVLVVVELVGGVAMILGFKTRYVGILFSVILFVALVTVKWSVGFISDKATGYEFDIVLLVVALYVSITQASGPIDQYLAKKSKN